MFLFDGAAAQCTPMMAVLLLYKLALFTDPKGVVVLVLTKSVGYK